MSVVKNNEEEFCKKMRNYKYSVIVKDDGVKIKTSFGSLLIRFNEKSYSIKKKSGFSDLSYIVGVIFFTVVVFDQRDEQGVIIYVLFVLVGLLYILYSNVMLEIQKARIHSILDAIYE